MASRAILLASLSALAACGLPRDADGTLDRVRGGTLRVGAVPNPPWITDSLGRIGGVEARLVEALARGLGARVAWVRRPQDDMMQALHARELDLVVGGLTSDGAWQKEVGPTQPYYTDTIAVGSPRGAPIHDLTSQRIAVEPGDATAAALRKRGAQPLVVADLKDAPGAVVAPTWRIDALGRTRGAVLREAPHVMAVPPGENAWLVYVDRFLGARRAAVPPMLRDAAP